MTIALVSWGGDLAVLAGDLDKSSGCQDALAST